MRISLRSIDEWETWNRAHGSVGNLVNQGLDRTRDLDIIRASMLMMGI
jgi:hypothetical protein